MTSQKSTEAQSRWWKVIILLLVLQTPLVVLSSDDDEDEEFAENIKSGGYNYRSKVDAALPTAKSLLESGESPRRILLASSDVQHDIKDEYSLAESITNAAVTSTANALDRLGLSSQTLLGLSVAAKRGNPNSFTLRFEANETCSLVEKKQANKFEILESGEYEMAYEMTATGELAKVDRGAQKEVTQYRYRFETSWEVALVQTQPGKAPKVTPIQSRTSHQDMGLNDDDRPPCSSYSHTPVEVKLGWFLQQLRMVRGTTGTVLESGFGIDSTDMIMALVDGASSEGLARNEKVKGATEWFEEWGEWGRKISAYYQKSIVNRVLLKSCATDEEGDKMAKDLTSVDDSTIFVPVLPLFQEEGNADKDLVLTASDAEVLLGEHIRTLDKALDTVPEPFPPADWHAIASAAEARLTLLSKHVSSIAASFEGGVSYLDGMLPSKPALDTGDVDHVCSSGNDECASE